MNERTSAYFAALFAEAGRSCAQAARGEMPNEAGLNAVIARFSCAHGKTPTQVCRPCSRSKQ